MSLLLAFDDETTLARRLADAAGLPLAIIERHRFPDGESRLRLPPSLPARTVLLRGLQQPNDKLAELMLAAAGANVSGVHWPGARLDGLLTDQEAWLRARGVVR